MNITVEQTQGAYPVTVIAVQGDLDASNFQELIAKAREAYRNGARNLLLDMSNTSFMSSSGIVALHNITALFNGEQAPDPETGWEAIHAVERLDRSKPQPRVKLLSPTPRVMRTLDHTALNTYFPIFTDRQEALDSFGAA